MLGHRLHYMVYRLSKQEVVHITFLTSGAYQYLLIYGFWLTFLGSIRNCRELALEHHVMLPEHLQSKISQQVSYISKILFDSC